MKKFITCVLVSMLLVGCSSRTKQMNRIDQMKKDTSAETRAAVDAEKKRISEIQQLMRDVPTPWFGKSIVPTNEHPQLPSVFNQKITLEFGEQLDFATAAEKITRVTGIPVEVNPDVFIPSSAFTPASTNSQTTGLSPQPINTYQSSSSQPRSEQRLSLKYQDNLVAIMDSVTARLGVNWEYKKGVIRVFRFETRMFSLRIMPGTATSSAGMSKSADGGASSESSSNTSGIGSYSSTAESEIKIDLDVWSSVIKSIESMLSPLGKVEANQTTGTVVVTDIPTKVNDVGKLIEHENLTANRQVNFDVNVYSLVTNDNEDFEIDWSLVYDSLQNAAIISSTSPASFVTSEVGSLGISLISKDGGSSTDFNGSRVFLKALSGVGDLSTLSRVNLSTTNNQTVPFAITQQTSYLARIDAAQGGDVAGTAGLEPGVVTSGFIIAMTPTIHENGTISLQMQLDISQLNALKTVSSGDQSIQTPEMSAQNITQRFSIRTGETIALPLFKRTIGQYDRRGLAKNRLFFDMLGSYKGEVVSEQIVVVLTAKLLDGA